MKESRRTLAAAVYETYTDLDELKDIMSDKGQNSDSRAMKAYRNNADISDFVLDKSIFSNVFQKDVRRVYLYKKAERLAKAIHLISPAFEDSLPMKERLDRIKIGLVDASTLPPSRARDALARELLTLSSLLAMARSGGVLSAMNADLIITEAHQLLAEAAGYEDPRIALDDVPSIAALAKSSTAGTDAREAARLRSLARVTYDADLDAAEEGSDKGQSKGQVKDSPATSAKKQGPVPAAVSPRRESILAVLGAKGPSYIKDISLVVRDVSEKTIQRELSQLVLEGLVTRKGDRRWTTYELATSL